HSVHSTLTPTVKVYDAWGSQLKSATATDPLKGNLTVQVGSSILGILTQLLGGSTYTVRVAGNTATAFAVGGYKLDVSLNLANGSVLSLLGGGGLLGLENGLNDLLTTALSLTSNAAGDKPDARFDYTYKASISTASDVDYYKV